VTAVALAPMSMTPRAGRANRAALAVIGLVLLATGVAGLLAGVGVFGDAVRHHKALGQDTLQWVDGHEWFWLVAAAGSALVALVALRWLFLQTQTNRVGPIDLESDRRRGRTILAADAVAGAVAVEIDSYRGVASASAHVLGTRSTPTLLTRVTLDDRGDPAAIRTRIQTEAIAHARQALDKPDLPVRLELRLAGHSRRDIR